jgi:hypothetical protein
MVSEACVTLKPLFLPGIFDQNVTMLWDAIAVYFAYDESLLKIERLPIHVEDDGRLSVSPRERVIRVATAWRHAEACADHLGDRLQRRRTSADPRRLYPVTKQPSLSWCL